MFGWGNRYAFPPNSGGPPPNGSLVDCNNITTRFSSAPIIPIGCNSHSPLQRRLGIPFPFLIFYSIFCPHQLHPLRRFPSILQA
ncbi:hypothetical protein ERO13_D13G151800v2 [Gossypium hirsutum]|nr:hypothetical protein ERO13_D13G151800v2 [Gossypium hirsutum]